MSDVAIRVEGIGKRYQLGGPRERYSTLRDQIGKIMSFRGLLRRNRPKPQPPFWALKDVSFEVKTGEVVGIIGRNGAGKSTLLKILSRITEPTEGHAELSGRVGSLLEVGTGFHPELTGRENIFLNGAILGMKRAEILAKFDDIVAFAEVERFIETPVKHYSSGMYMRLAFAVAAHLEPEILIVDEVLAVGDAGFQKKCLGKMGEVARDGRTVLFVSHNMSAISSLCQSVLWLNLGKLHKIGDAGTLILQYLSSEVQSTGGRRDLRSEPRSGFDQLVRFLEIVLEDTHRKATEMFPVGEPIRIRLSLESQIEILGEVGLTIATVDGFALFTTSSNDQGRLLNIKRGQFELVATLQPNYLRPGRYVVRVGTTCGNCRDYLPEAIAFEVVPNRHYSEGQLYNLPGSVHFSYEWTAEHGVGWHMVDGQ